MCSSDITSELRWTIAFFEWTERIQQYVGKSRWSYGMELGKFVDNGMTDDSFIDSVSRVLSFGCHSEDCASLEVRNAKQRKDNFYMIINDVFDIPSILESRQRPVPEVTPQPTFRLDLYEDAETPTPRPQFTPVLAPSLEVVQIPQSVPYEVPPIGYQTDETEMPTFDESDLIPLEGNGSSRLYHTMTTLLISSLALALF